MKSPVDQLLDEVASYDPDKAAHLRWVRPQLGDEAVMERARAYLAERMSGPHGAGWGARDTLLEVDLGFDPDGPTSQFAAFNEDEGKLEDEDERSKG